MCLPIALSFILYMTIIWGNTLRIAIRVQMGRPLMILFFKAISLSYSDAHETKSGTDSGESFTQMCSTACKGINSLRKIEFVVSCL